MEEKPCLLYTTNGINKIGTSLIVGHNRKNGKLFSSVGKLKVGDEFFFKDNDRREVRYVINSKLIKPENEVDFLQNKVEVPTIVLSTCTNSYDKNRTVIIGNAK